MADNPWRPDDKQADWARKILGLLSFLDSTNSKIPDLGQKTAAGSFPVVLALDQPAIPTTLDQYATVLTSNTITRPADTTAYVSGDLVANSTTAGSVTPFSFSNATRVAAGTSEIVGVRLYKSGTSISNANFRIHFYRATVTPSNGDNGAWLTPYDNYVGSFDVTMDKVFTNGAEGAGLPTVGMARRFTLPSGTTLFALIEVRGAYVPGTSEQFYIRAELSRF